jgi:hypothetical protein
MTAVQSNTPGLVAAPLAWMALWANAAHQAADASLQAWSAFARLQRQAGETYGAILGAAIASDKAGALAASDLVDEALRDELRLAETAADHLAHFGEEALGEAAGGPVFSLPE